MPDEYPQLAVASNPGRRINGLLFYALLLMVVLSPIPFGSNRAWSWSLCALIVSSLSLAWVFNAGLSRRTVSLSLPIPIIALFLFAVLWAFLQTSGFILNGWSHPLWAMAADALNATPQTTISITPDNSVTALMRLLSYGLTFFLCFQFCRNQQRANTTLKWLAISSILYALYGLIVYWGNINVFFWSNQAGDISSVRSTFINRNSYATFAGLGLVCLMAYSWINAGRQLAAPYRSPVGREKRVETWVLSRWKPALGLMLLTTALISTQSRGGFISAAVAVIGLLLIYAIKKNLNAKFLLSSIGGTLAMVLLAYFISSGPLSKRMADADLKTLERIQVFEITLDAIGDNPWTGFGYGRFEEGFKIYRNEAIQYIYDKTHNTYLENMFELGVPAALSLFLAFLAAILVALKGVFRRRRDWLYPATGVSASLLVATHSTIDFSLQIPAVAITYSAIMGMAVAQSFSSVKTL